MALDSRSSVNCVWYSGHPPPHNVIMEIILYNSFEKITFELNFHQQFHFVKKLKFSSVILSYLVEERNLHYIYF